MLILSFGWTWPALVARAKSVTRREWGARQLDLHQRAFRRNEPVQAYDKVPHAKGQRIGLIQYTSEPHWETLGVMPFEDYEAEGFDWFHRNPFAIPAAAKLRPWAADQCSAGAFQAWKAQEAAVSMVVCRFRILSITPEANQRLVDMARAALPG